MKRLFVTIVCLPIVVSLHGQGITLLYKNDKGWNDSLSWIQINPHAGQTPIQRVPTENDERNDCKEIAINGWHRGDFCQHIRFAAGSIFYFFSIGPDKKYAAICKVIKQYSQDLRNIRMHYFLFLPGGF